MSKTAVFAGRFRALFASDRGSRFRRNFVRIAKANVLVQLIALVLAPVLTRLYSPADFGTAALFGALLMFGASFATGRFEWSVPNARSPAEAAALVWLGALVLLGCTLAALGVLSLGGDRFVVGSPAQSLDAFAFLLPLALLGTGLRQLLQGWFTREADLTPVGRAQVHQSVFNSAVSVGGGIMGVGAIGLIAASTVASWAGLGVLLRSASRLRSALREGARGHMRDAFARFAGEAAISSCVSIVNVTTTAAMPFLLAAFYTTTGVGLYALMNRLVLVPIHLATTALGQSFWSEAAQLARQDRPALRQLYLRTARRLAWATLPVAAACVVGSLVVAPVFGREWTGAADILLALVPGTIAQMVAQPVTHLIVHGKQHWKLFLDAARLAATFSGVVWLAREGAALHHVVWWMSSVQAVASAVLFLLNLRCVNSPSPPGR